MNFKYLKRQHYLGFWTYFLLLNIKGLLKRRDKRRVSHNYCAYMWMKNGIVYYIGEGYFDETFWQTSRPFTHTDDMLANTLNSNWDCIIISSGLTKKEAQIIESKLISLCDRPLSKAGVYKWDGSSLINKQREIMYSKNVSFEELFEEYLNLENGNNYWETFRRQINRH